MAGKFEITNDKHGKFRFYLKAGVCGVIVASSLTLAACNQADNAESSSSTSTNTAAVSTTTTTAVAPVSGDQASAEMAIMEGYVKRLAECTATRDAVGRVMAIKWDPPGFKENQGGSGIIDDANPALGGRFTATFERGTFEGGRWTIDYPWC